MKSVLKRRKHRKGIRPVRKGTLKVNLQTLPTKEEHSQAITALMYYREEHAPLDIALEHLETGNKIAFDRIIEKSRYLNGLIASMQKGYDYFRYHRQVAPVDLALEVLVDQGPVIQEPIKPTNACDSCYLKNSCPFNLFPADQLEFVCPTKRRAYLDDVKRALRGKDLTVQDMAEQALTHLS